MNAYDNEYYNNNAMNFELNDYVDSTTYDQRLMLNVDAQYNNGLASSNNIGQFFFFFRGKPAPPKALPGFID